MVIFKIDNLIFFKSWLKVEMRAETTVNKESEQGPLRRQDES